MVCYDISVRASPDGRFFYLSYLSIQGSAFVSDVVVLRVSGDFSEVRGPFIAMRRRPAIIDKDWIDVHEVDASQANEVYVTATYFSPAGHCTMLFARSSDYGRHWTGPRSLARYEGCTFSNPGQLAARPLGGFGQSVLVCWYDTGSDGWGPGHGGGGTFNVACRSSSDDGATFGPRFYAVRGEVNELDYHYCPDGRYQRLWSAMFPALSIGPDGSAHLTYTSDPTPGVADGECGDIRYTRSDGPPYGTWTEPVTVAGGPMAQAFSGIAATTGGDGGCHVHVAYLDGRNSSQARPNRRYDVYRNESLDCGLTWGSPVRVTDVSSISARDFIGDYIDMTAAAGGDVHVVWADRRDEQRVDDPESDVFTDRWPA